MDRYTLDQIIQFKKRQRRKKTANRQRNRQKGMKTSLMVVISLDQIFFSPQYLTAQPSSIYIHILYICQVSTGAVQSQWLICVRCTLNMYFVIMFLSLYRANCNQWTTFFSPVWKQHNVGGCWYEMKWYLERDVLAQMDVSFISGVNIHRCL